MSGETVAIDGSVKKGLCELALHTYPYECCAALFGHAPDTIEAFCELKNRNGAEKSFSVDPAELYECENEYRRKGYEITGFFHSHPDAPALLSEEDEKYMIPSMLYLLASITEDGCRGLRLWRKDMTENESTDIGDIKIVL